MKKNFPNKFGIELEYMVVDSKTLDVKPIVSHLFKDLNKGVATNEIANSDIHWSNELVNHVVELKNPSPHPSLQNLDISFSKEISRINMLLEGYNSVLLPTAMHPWMRPEKETHLWPFAQKEIYKTYDEIFKCTGHGWSNLQSMHINIGFETNEEFERLHAATRIVLPLIPMVSASSPIYENKVSSQMSSRLMFYLQNQRRIPSILGDAIPEQIWSKEDYEKEILQPMYKDISPYDPKGLLQFEWLNSRAAIPKFERDSIEIRVTDINENPVIDISIAVFVLKILKLLIDESLSPLSEQKDFETLKLRHFFDDALVSGTETYISDETYLRVLGFGKSSPLNAKELISGLLSKMQYSENEKKYLETLEKITQKGTLSERILKSLNKDSSSYYDIYKDLTLCLKENRFFI